MSDAPQPEIATQPEEAICACGASYIVGSICTNCRTFTWRESGPASLSADEVEVAAKLMDKLLGEAIERKTGVMLSWEDAKGFALTLHAAATSITLARQAADQVWDATEALCREGDCNCPRDTCVISLRQEVVRLTAQARQMWEEREGWKRTASERGFELNALRERLAAGE